MHYLIVDVEAFGATQKLNPTTQIGATVIDYDKFQIAADEQFIKLESEKLNEADALAYVGIVSQFESYVLVEPKICLPLFEFEALVEKCIVTNENKSDITDVLRKNYMIDHEEEARCKLEFWNQHLQQYNKVCSHVYDVTKACQSHDVFNQFVEWARFVCKDRTVQVCTDTAGFDVGRLNNMITRPVSALSMNYLFLDDDGKPCYNSILDVDSFAEGVIAAIPEFKELKHPEWPIEHNHSPKCDSAYIGLQHLFKLYTIKHS